LEVGTEKFVIRRWRIEGGVEEVVEKLDDVE